MASIRVRDLVIGEGTPKICVPIVAKTEEEIINEAISFKDIDLDLVEWRIDWFEGIEDVEGVIALAKKLNETLGADIALLCTIRTAQEGGEVALSVEAYRALNRALIASGAIDLVDVELFLGDEVMSDLIACAHDNNVAVVASNHDFASTPSRSEIIARLKRMQDLGADILKIAVMPNSRHDVIELLAATEEMTSEHATQPVVSMSMGSEGAISRICGEIFGSAITFGCASKASAPGQIDVSDLRTMLTLIHNTL
jgi:3-dehydroquinate dehydratase-1